MFIQQCSVHLNQAHRPLKLNQYSIFTTKRSSFPGELPTEEVNQEQWTPEGFFFHTGTGGTNSTPTSMRRGHCPAIYSGNKTISILTYSKRRTKDSVLQGCVGCVKAITKEIKTEQWTSTKLLQCRHTRKASSSIREFQFHSRTVTCTVWIMQVPVSSVMMELRTES